MYAASDRADSFRIATTIHARSIRASISGSRPLTCEETEKLICTGNHGGIVNSQSHALRKDRAEVVINLHFFLFMKSWAAVCDEINEQNLLHISCDN